MVKVSEFGSKDFATATHVVDVPLPSAPPGHVLIKVAYTGIEASDVIQMAGGYGDLKGNVPAAEADGSHQLGDCGCEGVGTVTEVGADVSDFSIGQAVMWSGYGVSFREYVALPVGDAANAAFGSVVKVPTATPEWTAFPVSVMTAVGGLMVEGKVAAGQAVLVTGASGGTGHIAVQWAKRCGARVAGTCGSAAKGALLTSLGCDVVINYKEEDVGAKLRQEFPDGIDVVYDGVGGRVGLEAKRVLKPTGIFVGIGAVSTDYSGASKGDAAEATFEKLPGQTHTFFFMPNGIKSPLWPQLLADAQAAVASGEIKVMMDEECKKFPVGCEGVYAAQLRMRAGENVGKIFAKLTQD